MTKEEIARLRALLAKATPGPWESAAAKQGNRDGTITTVEMFVRREGGDVSIAAEVLDPETCKPSEANADLIAAAVNALPGLLAAAERGLDDGLVSRSSLDFGPERIDGSRVAYAVDGRRYDLCPSQARPPMWFWSTEGAGVVHAATAGQAIEAARAHDWARRGAK